MNNNQLSKFIINDISKIIKRHLNETKITYKDKLYNWIKINYWYDNGEFNDIKEANWVMTQLQKQYKFSCKKEFYENNVYYILQGSLASNENLCKLFGQRFMCDIAIEIHPYKDEYGNGPYYQWVGRDESDYEQNELENFYKNYDS